MRRSVHARTSGTLSSMLEEDPQSSPLCVGAGRKDERGVRGVDRSVARAEFSLGHQVIAHNSKERARAGLPLGGTTKCTAVARLQPVVAADDSGAARCGGRTPLPTLSTYFFGGSAIFIGSLKTWFVTERSVASSCRAFRSHIHEFSELFDHFSLLVQTSIAHQVLHRTFSYCTALLRASVRKFCSKECTRSLLRNFFATRLSAFGQKRTGV